MSDEKVLDVADAILEIRRLMKELLELVKKRGEVLEAENRQGEAFGRRAYYGD